MKDFVTEFEEYLNTRWSAELRYYTLRGERAFYESLWDESGYHKTAYGKVEKVDSSTDYDDGREGRQMILKIGDRYFQKSGYYDSWESSEWDGPLVEVQAVEKTITTYEVL